MPASTDLGRDYTLFATAEGFIKFESKNGRKVVSVYPEA
jgi:large subunit ribosomal protein L27